MRGSQSELSLTHVDLEISVSVLINNISSNSLKKSYIHNHFLDSWAQNNKNEGHSASLGHFLGMF